MASGDFTGLEIRQKEKRGEITFNRKNKEKSVQSFKMVTVGGERIRKRKV